MCDKNRSNVLNDEELWNKAGSGQPITRDDMGLNQNNRENGLQSLNEGFDYTGNGLTISDNRDDK